MKDETVKELSVQEENLLLADEVNSEKNDKEETIMARMTKYSMRDSMPVFSVPNVPKENLLTGSKNLLKWKSKIQLHLISLRLLDYIQSEYGEENVQLPISRRVEHDSQALQVLHVTISSNIVDLIIHKNTAYAVYKRIFELFEGNRCAELTLAEEKYEELIFKSYYDDIRFVNKFDKMHREFRELGTTYDKENWAARFLFRIEDKHTPNSPYFNFYHNMRSLPPEMRKYEYIKKQFLTVDNSYLK